MSTRTLIRGGCVLTLGARTPNFAEADVLVEDGRVAEVGRGLRARDAEVVEALDTIVMPGFVDVHRHAWKTLLRNLGSGADGGTLPVGAYGPHHAPDDVYAATLLALLSAVENGITTVVDWADLPRGDAFTEAALQAHADVGLRTVFAHAAPTWDDGDDGADEAATLRRLLDRAGAGGLLTLALGPADPRADDFERVAAAWSLAREHGLRIHAHAGPRTAAGVVGELGEKGLLGADVTLVHCSSLGGDDLDAVSSAGAAVALTPSSEMAVLQTRPPLQALIDRGIRPGLGVDDELVAPGDLFAQMRAVQSLQHASVFDLKLAGKAGVPDLLGTRDVIRYATIDGARAAGLGEVTGSIEPGKRADLVLLRTDLPNISPVNDPIGAVVWGMDASNVDWVFVEGRPLVRHGSVVGDAQRARDLAYAARDRVAAAAGLLLGTGAGGAQ